MKPTIGLKILLFFARHPDEELSYRDMQIKFDTTYNSVRRSVGVLVRNGWLTSIKRQEETSKNAYVNYFMPGPTFKEN